MNPIKEFQVPEELRKRGIERITKQKETLLVEYNGEPIRFDIESKWSKTIMNFEKSAKDLIKDIRLRQAIIFCVSDLWLDLIEHNSTSNKGGLTNGAYSNPSDNRREEKTAVAEQYQKDERVESKKSVGVDGTEDDQDESAADNEALVTVDPIKELDPYIESRDYSEFVISTIKRTVKREDATIRQVLYTALSKDTRNPLNLAILAPTSEGKTHVVQQTISYFPNEKVWVIGSMSPKVIIRQNGILVDKNNDPLKPVIKALEKEIREEKAKGDNADEDKIEELRDRVDELYKDARRLIKLTGILFVFLEPPHPEMWNILKPMLSHDAYEIEHPYVEKIEGTGYTVKKIITRGWPACIFCSAKDESKWPSWPEIQSRFLITSPNMVPEKYLDANVLIAQKMGLPKLMQEALIVSSAQVELAKKCVLFLSDQILKLGVSTWNPVWIPFAQILSEILPSEKGTDNRITKRIFSFLSIITLSRAGLRGRLVYGGEILIIANLEDLDEVLHITQNTSGMPAYKLDFYREIFLPLYGTKVQPDTDGAKQEKIIGVTTRELCNFFYDKKGRPITSNNVKQTYLGELLNNGLIDEADSVLDKRQKIYYPIVKPPFEESKKDKNCIQIRVPKIKDSLISERMDNILQHPKLIIPKNCREIPGNWLKMEIFDLMRCPFKLNRFELYYENDHLCICRFAENYEKDGNLMGYLWRPNSYNYHSNYFRIIEYMGGNNIDRSNKLSIQSEVNNSFIANMKRETCNETSKSNVDTSDNNTPLSLVNEFFYDNPDLAWQPLPDHTLEESPCHPIIETDRLLATGQKYYRCKVHPEIWNINLESIEHHCKYKDPDRHKSEILRLMESKGCN